MVPNIGNGKGRFFAWPVFMCKEWILICHGLYLFVIGVDSVSSFEVNSSFERIPPSPARATASPRNIPHSPRFSMSLSPRLTRPGPLYLNFSQVVRATQNFSPSMRIGKGAFGIVYKGYLEDGQVVAIKRAKGVSGACITILHGSWCHWNFCTCRCICYSVYWDFQDHFMDRKNQFSREVELLAKIDHQNLVKLFEFINKGDECLIITEYVPNGTLRSHLYGKTCRPWYILPFSLMNFIKSLFETDDCVFLFRWPWHNPEF